MEETRIEYALRTGNLHEHITNLGTSAQEWWTVPHVIDQIRLGNRFYTYARGFKAYLVVRYNAGMQREYVQTERDPVPENNLLNLPPGPGYGLMGSRL